MDKSLSQITASLTPAMLYGIAAVGVALPLRLLRTADLTALGAVSFSGVLAVYTANHSIWPLGILVGSLAGLLLGTLTAWMFCQLHVPAILAGIISFIAANGFALLFARDGTVDLKVYAPLEDSFSFEQAGGVAAVCGLVCGAIAVLARSKYGTLSFAMLGADRFVRFRHRHAEATTFRIFGVSGLLVGFSGSLLAFKVGSGHAEAHPDFLPIVFGAIFCGEAAVAVLLGLLKKKAPVDEDYLLGKRAPQQSTTSFVENFRLSLSDQRDDSRRFGILAISYIAAAIILKIITAEVKGLNSYTHISPALESLIVAFMIAAGFVISRRRFASE